eukprot:gene14830-16492_t
MDKTTTHHDLVMSNDYNKYCEPQLCAIQTVLQILEKKVFVEHDLSSFMNLVIEKHHKTLRISDYGCSTGRNSLLFMNELYEIMREVFQVKFTVHSFLLDLSGNNFNDVIRVFEEKMDGCKNDDNHQSYLSVGVGDLYRQSLPSRTVSFTCTFASMHWLSNFSSHHYDPFKDTQCCYVSCANDENDQELVHRIIEHSREDLVHYLLARKEVEKGGLVVFSCLGYGSHIRPTNHEEELTFESSVVELGEGDSAVTNASVVDVSHIPTMPGAHRICKGMGKLLLTTKEKFGMNEVEVSSSMPFLPIVPRAKKDVILYNEIHDNKDPIWEKFLLHQYSEEEYVEKEVGFIRAWSESCIKDMLHYNEDAVTWFYDEMKRLIVKIKHYGL